MIRHKVLEVNLENWLGSSDMFKIIVLHIFVWQNLALLIYYCLHVFPLKFSSLT